MTLVWMIASYLLGAIPFSVLLARHYSGVELSDVGDGNPGAANAWKASGKWVGIAALVLDFLKGAVPVALAHYALKIDGWELAAIAICPVLGHAWSIFLGFRGGKALAVTFGIWTGLTLAEAPLVLGFLFIAGILLLKDHAWTVILGMIGLLLYLFLRGSTLPSLAVWTANMAILTYKHLPELGAVFKSRRGDVNG